MLMQLASFNVNATNVYLMLVQLTLFSVNAINVNAIDVI